MVSNKTNFVRLCVKDPLPTRFDKIKNGKFSSEDLDYPLHLYLQENDVRVHEENSDIVKFLKGKNILVTGATGFLGKLLVEKLLRSCEDIKLYLIVRSKKNDNVQSRIDEMLNSCVFHPLAKIRPNFRKNVIGITGDLSEPELGLNSDDKNELLDKINIIYHAAATVRFDEPLRKAVNCNVLGAVEIIKLAKKCKNLDVFTHISTAYSNCDRKLIKEEFYKPTATVEQLRLLANTLPDENLEKITPGLLGKMPNIYTLTKQSIEDYMRRELPGIPACICRPSIVLSSLKEPFFAWSDNVLGPTGFITAIGAGLIHMQRGKSTNKCDIIPADFVVNHCIAASFRTAKERDLSNVPIYNCVSSPQNPHSWENIYETAAMVARKIGGLKTLSDPFYIQTNNEYWFKIGIFLLHDIPAYIVDFALICSGNKPMLREGYKKIHKFSAVLAFFTLNVFEFDNSNTLDLWNSLSDTDKKNFNFDMTSFDWRTYYTRFAVGAKENILNEPIEKTIDASRARSARLIYIRKTFSVIFFSILFLLLIFIFNKLYLFDPVGYLWPLVMFIFLNVLFNLV